uniref:DNA repair metallo-beta-lactamase domain-containing protein n=1 Tax=Setaria digitata TaxID=48799 RepID=A0A915PP67_9BILA
MDGFRVMFIDANHAPGAVMIVVEGKGGSSNMGRILYTGFFRADTKFYWNVRGLSALQERRFDVICLDSTYIDFAGNEFPSRRSSAKEAANLLRMLKYSGVDSVAVPVPIIGHESFLVNISRELKCKIWLHPERFEIAHILGIEDYFSDMKEDTFIWTCSQIESQQVLSTTDSHIIKTSTKPCLEHSRLLNNKREHIILYSDHCSLAELQSFLSLLSFSRIIGIPNKLPRLVEDDLQKLSLSGIETTYRYNDELDNPKLIKLSFDYAFRKLCQELHTIENFLQLPADENMEEIVSKTSHFDDFMSKQGLKRNNSGIDRWINVLNSRDSNSKIYLLGKFFANFLGSILDNGSGGGETGDSIEAAEKNTDEMAVQDVEYVAHIPQRMEDSARDNYESRMPSTKLAIKILEEQCDVSILLDNLANAFYKEDISDASPDEAELVEFLSDMDISKAFNDFDDLYGKYRERNTEIKSVEIMNQSYHAEKKIAYDPSNAPIISDVICEWLDSNSLPP